MNKEKAIAQVRADLEDHLLRIEKAAEIAAKLEGLLPEGWEADYVSAWQGLLISRHYNGTPVGRTEFAGVCGLVQQAIGLPLEREPWFAEEQLFALLGSARIPYGHPEWKMPVEVRLMDTTNCRVEYEEKIMRIPKLTEGCLGLDRSKGG